MTLLTEPYSTQVARWPMTGRHILAQFTDDAVVVYQAYCPAIGRFAVQNKHFGGDFSLTRMSWIKTNFLWMMYRSGWGTKENQEMTLAIRLRRTAFDDILRQAVPSTFDPALYPDERAWREAVRQSDVRLQWDPDHTPAGGTVERRAIQLGLRSAALVLYAHDWIIDVEDISDFVAEQRPLAQMGAYARLLTPREDVYPVGGPETAARLGVVPADRF
jgi:hypothetical protein